MISVFLAVIGLVWLAVASFQDIRKREVPNWLSFSLITIVLAYKAIYSAINSDLRYFIYGVFGLGIFVGLAYLFYYSRIFAGGDAKLMFGFGALLPVYSFNVLAVFIFLLLFSGGIYGLIWSIFLALSRKKEFKLEFSKQFKKMKRFFILVFIPAILLLIIPIYLKQPALYFFPVIVLVLPWMYAYAKSVEIVCMIKSVSGRELTVGDWLAEPVKIKGRIINPNWEGLDEKEVLMLKNLKNVKIKNGIPFIPAFLIAFILLLVLWNSSWSFFQLLNF